MRGGKADLRPCPGPIQAGAGPVDRCVKCPEKEVGETDNEQKKVDGD